MCLHCLSDRLCRPCYCTNAVCTCFLFCLVSQCYCFLVLQEAHLRQSVSTAERPLPGHPQSQEGALQEALPLPALVAPALAAANPDQAYLRWKGVIHSMPINAPAAACGPDFSAARWFHDQMSYQQGSAPKFHSQGGCFRLRLLFKSFAFVYVGVWAVLCFGGSYSLWLCMQQLALQG